MITVEQWVTHRSRTLELRPTPIEVYETAYVKAIQLDALKEGMWRAADYVTPQGCQPNSHEKAAIQAILSAAEQLTVKDL